MGETSWRNVMLDHKPFTLKPSDGWPERMPNHVQLELDFVPLKRPPPTAHPLSADQFEELWKGVACKSTATDEWRLQYVKLLSTCVYYTSEMVAEMCQDFHFSGDRINACQVLFGRIVDPQRLFLVEDVFYPHQWDEVVSRLGALAAFHPRNASGRYTLNLARQLDYSIAVRLRQLAFEEQQKGFLEGNPFRECWRRVSLDGHAVPGGEYLMTRDSLAEFDLPNSGYLTLDYVSFQPLVLPRFSNADLQFLLAELSSTQMRKPRAILTEMKKADLRLERVTGYVNALGGGGKQKKKPAGSGSQSALSGAAPEPVVHKMPVDTLQTCMRECFGKDFSVKEQVYERGEYMYRLEAPASTVVFIVEGEADVLKPAHGASLASEEEDERVSAGCWVGEEHFFNSKLKTRQHSLLACTVVKAWYFDFDTLRQMVHHSGDLAHVLHECLGLRELHAYKRALRDERLSGRAHSNDVDEIPGLPHAKFVSEFNHVFGTQENIKKVSYGAGETVFATGEEAKSAVFVVSGEGFIEVPSEEGDTPHVIARARPGIFSGEMPIMSGQKVYNTTLRAASDMAVYELTPMQMNMLRRESVAVREHLTIVMARKELGTYISASLEASGAVDTLSKHDVELRIQLLRQVAVHYSLSSRQLLMILASGIFTRPRDRIEAVVSVFQCIHDRKMGFHNVQRGLTAAEQALLGKRLGWMQVTSTLKPTGHYKLDLHHPEDHEIFKRLCRLAVRGGNDVNLEQLVVNGRPRKIVEDDAFYHHVCTMETKPLAPGELPYNVVEFDFWMAPKQVLLAHVLHIQASWRRHLAIRRFQYEIAVIVRIQVSWRMFLARRGVRALGSNTLSQYNINQLLLFPRLPATSAGARLTGSGGRIFRTLVQLVKLKATQQKGELDRLPPVWLSGFDSALIR